MFSRIPPWKPKNMQGKEEKMGPLFHPLCVYCILATLINGRNSVVNGNMSLDKITSLFKNAKVCPSFCPLRELKGKHKSKSERKSRLCVPVLSVTTYLNEN